MAASFDPFNGTAAQTQFFLRVQGLPDGMLHVDGFQSESLALSSDYQVVVETVAWAGADLDPDELIDRTVSLSLYWQGGDHAIHGVITAVEHTDETSGDQASFAVTISSPLNPLTRRRGNRVFRDKDVVGIARQVLTDAGLPPEAMRFDIRETPPRRPYVVQYEETDLEFFERQLAYHGLVYAFETSPERATVVVTDGASRLANTVGTIPVDYQSFSGQARDAATVYEWHRRSNRVIAGVRLRDYNYEAPRRSLDVTAGDSDAEYRYGECYGDLGEGERLARLRLEAHTWQQRTVTAATDCRAVLPGTKLKVGGLPTPDDNGDWLIVAARISGDQRAARRDGCEQQGPTFRAELTVIPASVPYRTPIPESRRTVHGQFTAHVEGDGGDYAYLDDMGRYRLRMPFDLSDRPDAEASHPVRMVQAYGGQDYGLHFPLHHGTEVVVSCINGDIDRPVILGALHNADTPNPVTGNNPSQNILRTWGGNELLMEDKTGEERVELFTRDRRNRLALDAAEDEQQVTLESRDGDFKAYAGQNMSWEAGRDHSVDVGRDQTVTIHRDQRLLTREGMISLKAAEDINLKAAQNIRMQAEAMDVGARAGRNLRVGTGGKTDVQVHQGDTNVKVSKGSLHIDANRDISFRGNGGGNITIAQEDGTIDVDTKGNVAIKGPKVKVVGQTIEIEGKNVGNNSQ